MHCNPFLAHKCMDKFEKKKCSAKRKSEKMEKKRKIK